MGSTLQNVCLWSDTAIMHERRPTVGLVCNGERKASSASLKKRNCCQPAAAIRMTIQASANNASPPPPASPKRDSFSPKKIFEGVRLRLGFKGQNVASSRPDGEEADEEEADEEEALEQELVSLGILKTPEDEGTATSVTPDDLDPSVLWEQGESDLEAEKRKRATMTSPGFSFSAAGHLFPYHLGVCQCLIENGYLKDSTPLAGSSAGALVCAVVAGGLTMSEALKAAKEVAQDCRERGTTFRVGAVLRGIMEKYLPEDAHKRVNGRIRIGVTQIFRKPRGLLVDQFESREDLINALHTSCFIPGYFAPRPVTIFRNRVCIDGGFTQFMPPTAADMTVRICALVPSAYKIQGVEISPDVRPVELRPTNQELLSLALKPAEDEVLDDIFRVGYEDASYWVKQQSPAVSSPAV